MKKYTLLLITLPLACSPVQDSPAQLTDMGATGTTFDSQTSPAPPPTESGDGEIPSIPTTGEPSTDASLTSSTTATTHETGGAPPVCGDGVVEGAEQCDDTYDANKPENPCTAECLLARCGDGHIQASNDEVCDDGPHNAATPGYGECSTACLRETYCGDGVVQSEAGEECEPGGGGGDVDTCGAMCRHAPRLVFVTSAKYSGDLDGLAGADKRCNELAAQQQDLTGTYRAWLMVDGQVLADRFPEFAEPVAWNFTNTAADLLAKSFADLIAHGPAQPIGFTEAGDPLPEAAVWTGITADGLAAGGDCGQWTSEAGSAALVGSSGYLPNVGPDALQWQIGRQWTDRNLKDPCFGVHHIYCVQVAD